MFRVVYDFSRPNWHTYGHVLYVADESMARDAVLASEGAVTIDRCDVRPALDGEFERYEAQRARMAQWLENTASGKLNRRGDL